MVLQQCKLNPIFVYANLFSQRNLLLQEMAFVFVFIFLFFFKRNICHIVIKHFHLNITSITQKVANICFTEYVPQRNLFIGSLNQRA